MGTRLPFCLRRGATFYWRRRLPSPSKMSVEFSLGTKDERVARRLCSVLAAESDRAFVVLREGGMTPDQIEVLMRHKFAEHRAQIELLHVVGLDSRSDWKTEVNASRAAALAMNTLAVRGRRAQIDPASLPDDADADDLSRLAQQNIDFYRNVFWSEERSLRTIRELKELFPADPIGPADVAQARSAMLQAFAAANASVARKYAGVPATLADIEALADRLEQAVEKLSSPQPVVEPQGTTAPDIGPRKAIIAFTEETVAEEVARGRLVSSTGDQKLTVLTKFVWATGKEYFQDLKQSDIKQYVDCLSLIPKNHKAPQYAGLTAEELMAKSAFLPKKEVGLDGQTINRNLSYLTKLMRQAQMAGVENLPALQIGAFRVPKKVRSHEQRPGYSADDVELLFTHPIWTGCHSPARRHVPGDIIVWDGLYWCPLISAYSGVRREEIAAMQVAEVVLEGDVPHFVIKESENRGLKTLASVRTVPIHSALFALGIDRYVRQQQKAGEIDLFPDLRPTSGTKTSWGDKLHYGFAKAVKLTLGAAHVERSEAKTFHSFRHYICTALDRVEAIKDKTIKDIVGHENVGTTDRVYKEPALLAVKLAALNFLPDLTTKATTAIEVRTIVPARSKASASRGRSGQAQGKTGRGASATVN
nr:site-specific integrase [uncultured Devosia sp.]